MLMGEMRDLLEWNWERAWAGEEVAGVNCVG